MQRVQLRSRRERLARIMPSRPESYSERAEQPRFSRPSAERTKRRLLFRV